MSARLRIATYNVEWFANLFDKDDRLVADDDWSARWNVTRHRQAEAIAHAIRAVDADAMLIVEAPNSGHRQSSVRALERFAETYRLRQRRAVTGFVNGTRQELTVIFDPDRVSARHDPRGAPFTAPRAEGRLKIERLGPEARAPRFDSVLPLDIDEDGLVDLHVFSKPPVELEMEAAGAPKLRLIGVHAKSKAPHDAEDEADAIRLQIANRRKHIAQCVWLRRRVERHLDEEEDVIVLGDFNDGPGIDRYERLFGRSGVEVVMGDVDRPETLLRNPHMKARLHPDVGWRPATARFYMRDRKAYMNALIDFVMLSPTLADRAAPRWRIWHPFDDAECYAYVPLRNALLDASDHFPVSVDLTFG